MFIINYFLRKEEASHVEGVLNHKLNRIFVRKTVRF